MEQIIKILILFITISGYGQFSNQKVLASFNIQKGIDDGLEINDQLIDQKAQIIFYNESNKLMMSNFWTKDNSQSFGKVYSFRKKIIEATTGTYKYEVYHFKWKYQNTYSNVKGIAKVKLLAIYDQTGVLYQMTIVPDNLNVLIYKGFVNNGNGPHLSEILSNEL